MRQRLLARWLLVLGLTITAALASGCWDRIEVQTLAFVTETGIDPAPAPMERPFGREGVELTARVANTTPGGVGSGPGTSAVSSGALVVGRGLSPVDALVDIQSVSGRVIFVAHNRAAVVSSELAGEGRMSGVIDFFDRSRQARRTTLLLIADGVAAREVVSVGTPLSDQESSGLYELVLFNHQRRGMPLVTLNDFIVRATEEGIDPIAVRVGVVPLPPHTGGGPSRSQSGTESNAGATVTGTALFREDTLVGFLDEEATRGLLWASGELSHGNINVPCPITNKESFVFEVKRSTGKISIETEPELRGTIKITMEGDFAGLTCPGEGYRTTSKTVQVAQEHVKERVQESVRRAIEKAQEVQSDPFGFGAALFRKDHRAWGRLQDRWRDSVWPTLPVDIDLEVNIRRAGLVGPPYQITD